MPEQARPKRSRDFNQLAASIVDAATDEDEHEQPRRRSRDIYVAEALRAAHLPLIRFTARSEYAPRAVAVQIDAVLEHDLRRDAASAGNVRVR